MKSTISLNDFRNAFEDYGYANQFSNAGLEALYHHIEELETSTGTETELDVIALCCDYTEATLCNINQSYRYGFTLEDFEQDTEAFNQALFNKLQQHTQAVLVGSLTDADCTVVYRDY
jgi:hypothetical protein